MLGIVLVGSLGLLFCLAVVYRVSADKIRMEKFRKQVENKKGAAALPAFKKRMQQKTGSLEAHYLLGMAYLQADLFDKAVKELEFAYSLNSREKQYPSVKIARSLAEAYEKMGDFKNAQGTLLIELKNSPMDFKLLVQVAEIFMHRGMPKHGADYMEMALRIDPENSALLLKMAQMLEKANDLRGAVGYAEKAFKFDKASFDACKICARIYYSFANYKKSEHYYGALSMLDGGKLDGILGKSDCQLAQGNRNGSIYLLEKALRICENDLENSLAVQYKLAMLYVQDREIVKGMSYLEQIEQLKPGYRDVRKYLAQYGDFRKNDQLAAYAFSNNTDFASMAESLLAEMGTLQHKSKVVKKRDFVYFARFDEKEYTENVYIYFSRKMSPLSEWELQEIVNEIRLVRIRRGVVFCVGGFTKKAATYAASRSLTLIDRQELVNMLKTVSFVPAALSAVS